MCSPARALLPCFESKQERSVPRRETAAKGRCSLPFTSCFGAQRQDQTPSQPLALSPASAGAPRAEGLTLTGSAAQQAQHHTLRTRCRLLCQPGDQEIAQKQNEIKCRHACWECECSSPLLLPCTSEGTPFSLPFPCGSNGAITAYWAPELFLAALACA